MTFHSAPLSPPPKLMYKTKEQGLSHLGISWGNGPFFTKIFINKVNLNKVNEKIGIVTSSKNIYQISVNWNPIKIWIITINPETSQSWFFYSGLAIPVLELHIHEMIWDVLFHVRLFFLTQHDGFEIYLCCCIYYYPFCWVVFHFVPCMNIPQFLNYFPINELNSFQFGTTMNKISMNIYIWLTQIFLWTCVLSLD